MSETKVLYNAACPICRAEIEHYRSYAEGQGLSIRFDDLNGPLLEEWGITARAAEKRLHLLKDGKLLTGVSAFIGLWEEMPRFRWLARVVALPGIFHIASAIYDHILAPLLYTWMKHRRAKLAETEG